MSIIYTDTGGEESVTAAQVAAANAPTLPSIETRAAEIGGVLSGASQNKVDAIVAAAQSGELGAYEAQRQLDALYTQYGSRLGAGDDGTDNDGTDTTEKKEDPTITALKERIKALEAGNEADSARRRNDARATIARVLKTYGLDSLSDYLYGIVASDEINLNNPDAIVFSIRERPEYQTRFAANKARLAAGLPELDPGTYVALEEQYRATLKANGLPTDFYDKPDDFQAWLEGDVSPAEIQQRVEEGYRAVADADPEVTRQMTRLYGVGAGDLAAYFLDPKRAEPLFKTKQLIRQAQAAKIAARAKEQGAIDLAAATAEELVSRGITPEAAQAGFGKMTQLAGLYQEMAGEETLTEAEKIGVALGYNEAATKKLEARLATRRAQFAGGGGFARTTGATSGTVETGLGGPQ